MKSRLGKVTLKGVTSGGLIIPASVDMINRMRARDFQGKSVHIGVAPKKASVSRIRKNAILKREKLLWVSAELRRQRLSQINHAQSSKLEPMEFMQKNKLSSKAMLVLTETFLKEFNKKDKFTTPKNVFHVQDKLRAKIGALPEEMIRSYSTWVYLFTLEKGNRAKLAAFRKRLVQGKI